MNSGDSYCKRWDELSKRQASSSNYQIHLLQMALRSLPQAGRKKLWASTQEHTILTTWTTLIPSRCFSAGQANT